MEPLCPQEILQGGDEGKVDAHLLVELTHLFGKSSAGPALSEGLVVQEEEEANDKRHEGPCQGQTSPARVINQQPKEGEEVSTNICRGQCHVEEQKAKNSQHPERNSAVFEFSQCNVPTYTSYLTILCTALSNHFST